MDKVDPARLVRDPRRELDAADLALQAEVERQDGVFAVALEDRAPRAEERAALPDLQAPREQLAVLDAADGVGALVPVGLAEVEPEEVDDLGVRRPRHVGRDGDAVGLEAVELGHVAVDKPVFERPVLHAAEHPADERAVGEGNDGTPRGALLGRRAVEPAQLELVAERRDDLGREVAGDLGVVRAERGEVLAAVPERGFGADEGRLRRAVMERHAADVEEVACGIDVPVGEDLAAVGRDDGHGRRTRRRVERAVGARRRDGAERPLANGLGARGERFPVGRAAAERVERAAQAVGLPRVFAAAIRHERGELRGEGGEVDHRDQASRSGASGLSPRREPGRRRFP